MVLLEFKPRQFDPRGLALNHHATLPLSIIINERKSLLPQVKVSLKCNSIAASSVALGKMKAFC